jgi:hypothetical protein
LSDAFCNALGNSIVSSVMPAIPQQAEKKAEAAAEQAKRRGASAGQVEAIRLETYARERGAVVEPVTTTSDGRRIISDIHAFRGCSAGDEWGSEFLCIYRHHHELVVMR